jgi:hypothetical protein
MFSDRLRTLLAVCLAALATLPARAIIPENGWWWVSGESGSGFNLEVQDNLLFFASFGYDTSGNPVWYTAGGAMTSDRDFAATLFRTSAGSCVGCPYRPPIVTEVGTMRLTFSSSQNATLTLAGATVPVTRFNFWLNESRPDAMGGEWSFVIGESAFPVFDGERIGFTRKVTDSAGTYMSGSRLGSASNTAVVQYNNNLGKWTLLLDSSTTAYRYFEFNTTGFNRLEGQFWVYSKGSSPSGAGTFFQAHRSASLSFLTTGRGPASSKRDLAAEGFAARSDQLLIERLAAQPAGEVGDGAHRSAVAAQMEAILKKTAAGGVE